MPVRASFARDGGEDDGEQGKQGPAPRPEARQNRRCTGGLAQIANSVGTKKGMT
jgi:hypothetical protein